MVVNSLMTCIVSDKQLTLGLAGISMTLVLLSFGVVVINSWSLETRERKRKRKHLKRKSKFWTGLLTKRRSCISITSCMCIGVTHNGLLHVHIACYIVLQCVCMLCVHVMLAWSVQWFLHVCSVKTYPLLFYGITVEQDGPEL